MQANIHLVSEDVCLWYWFIVVLQLISVAWVFVEAVLHITGYSTSRDEACDVLLL